MIVIFTLISLLRPVQKGETHYGYSDLHREAYEKIISLQFDQSAPLLEEIRKQFPQNPAIHHIENYRDCIQILINEDFALYEQLLPQRKIRLQQVKKIKSSDPHNLFYQAEIILQWAAVKIRFGEYLSAVREINSGIALLEKNVERFPDFMPNYKYLSIIRALAGTIPEPYKSILGSISSIDGTIDQGLLEIEKVIQYSRNSDDLFLLEATGIKVLILDHLKNDKTAAWKTLNELNVEIGQHPLWCFLAANTAMRLGHNNEAIQILQSRINSPRFAPFPHLNYLMGTALLNRLDPDADVYLETFIENFNGSNQVKSACRKLAWHALVIRKNEAKYIEWMQLCTASGSRRTDEDKAAQKEAEKKTTPNPELLTARILTDGGYPEKADSVLQEINITLLSEQDLVEYYYRNGRIRQSLEKDQEALESFGKCITLGRNLPDYFACNAALQSGILLEKKDPETAESFFQLCLEMDPEEYKNSLHQKARAALIRLRTK